MKNHSLSSSLSEAPLPRRVAIYGQRGILYFTHRREVARLLQAGQIVKDDQNNFFVVGNITPDDRSRRSTSTTVLHRREGQTFSLKPVHELAFCGLVGVRL